MRSAILAAIFSAVALAASSSSEQVVNPATQYLTETNSLGVVTGQPTPIISQSPAASIPAGLSSVPVVSVPVVSGASSIVTVPIPRGSSSAAVKSNSTSTALSSTNAVTRTSTASSGSSTSSSTGTASGSKTSSSNAAIMATAAPVGLSLGLAGAVFAAFL